MKKINIYTDGSCRGNPGAGGWCAILVYGENERVLSGGMAKTTNNRMELTALIEGLNALKEPCEVELYTDSKYITDAMTLGWAKSWKSRGWKRSNKEDALNPDLWQRVLDLTELHSVKFNWVRGHNGHEYNERCDEIACAEADKYK